MPRQEINVGTVADDGTGAALRTAFIKINEMTRELFDGSVELGPDGSNVRKTLTEWLADVLAVIAQVESINLNMTETVQDIVAASLIPGSGLQKAYSDALGTITIGLSSTFNEIIDDRVAALLRAGDNINLTYNDASNTLTISASGATGPIVGQLIDYAGPTLPPLCLWPDGRNVSRTTYSVLLEALTLQLTATRAAGSATLSGLSMDPRFLGLVGAKVEGSGIPAGISIASVSQTTITLSTGTGVTAGTGTIRIFPHGNGDGSATFSLPDVRDRVTAGRGDMGGTAANRLTSATSGIDGTRLGAAGGDERMFNHSHSYNDQYPGMALVGGTTQNSNGGNMTSASSTTGTSGAGTAQNVPPTLVLNKVIYAGA